MSYSSIWCILFGIFLFANIANGLHFIDCGPPASQNVSEAAASLADSTIRDNQSIRKAASYIRYLVANEITGIVSTITCCIDNYHDHGRRKDLNYTFSAFEDFTCAQRWSGDIVFLFADISTSAKNLVAYPYASFTIIPSNCIERYFNRCPYVTFVGEFVLDPNEVLPTNLEFIQFASKHPKAVDQLKTYNHTFHLWYFNPLKIHFASGSSSINYNGEIPWNIYYDARPVNY